MTKLMDYLMIDLIMYFFIALGITLSMVRFNQLAMPYESF